MREHASHIKDPFISGGFISLAEQYDRLAEDGALWLQRRIGAEFEQPAKTVLAERRETSTADSAGAVFIA